MKLKRNLRGSQTHDFAGIPAGNHGALVSTSATSVQHAAQTGVLYPGGRGAAGAQRPQG